MTIPTEESTAQKGLLSYVDQSAVQWIQQTSQEFFTLMSYYKCAMMEVETKFNVLNEEFSLQLDRNPISGIKTRLKSFSGIREKLERKGLPLNAETMQESLNDIAGVRVVCSFLDDIYLLAGCLLQQDDVTLLDIKDYISEPKPNGYRSLHLIVQIPIYLRQGKRNVKVEIQLRTIAMDCWASLEHQLRYKKEFGQNEDTARELLECARLSAELDARMESLRKEVLSTDADIKEDLI